MAGGTARLILRQLGENALYSSLARMSVRKELYYPSAGQNTHGAILKQETERGRCDMVPITDGHAIPGLSVRSYLNMTGREIVAQPHALQQLLLYYHHQGALQGL